MIVMIWLITIAIAGLLYLFALIHLKKENQQEKTKYEKEQPCDYCIRWSECNGVDKEYCPLCENQNRR